MICFAISILQREEYYVCYSDVTKGWILFVLLPINMVLCVNFTMNWPQNPEFFNFAIIINKNVYKILAKAAKTKHLIL